MHRMRRGCLSAGLIALSGFGSRPSQAQYTTDFQTNIISSVTSNWSGSYIVGNTNFGDALLIQNGGILSNGSGSVGNNSSGSNNSVVVSGSGSVWSNVNNLTIGVFGVSNSMLISAGGKVYDNVGVLGSDCSQSGCINTSYCNVVVNGPGSTWSNGTLWLSAFLAGATVW